MSPMLLFTSVAIPIATLIVDLAHGFCLQGWACEAAIKEGNALYMPTEARVQNLVVFLKVGVYAHSHEARPQATRPRREDTSSSGLCTVHQVKTMKVIELNFGRQLQLYQRAGKCPAGADSLKPVEPNLRGPPCRCRLPHGRIVEDPTRRRKLISTKPIQL